MAPASIPMREIGDIYGLRQLTDGKASSVRVKVPVGDSPTKFLKKVNQSANIIGIEKSCRFQCILLIVDQQYMIDIWKAR